MPELVKLYIRQVFVGFALSAVFVALLLWQNVGNLGHLVLASDIGWLAALMLFVFNGLVFAGVQFSISVMRMGENNGPKGGARRAARSAPAFAMARGEADQRG